MDNRGINILLVIVTVAMLVLLAFRVSFEKLSGSGCSGVEGSSCALNKQR
jgi:hypothetical protein